MKVKQYFPCWQISVGDTIFAPAAPGETPVAITGLPDDEIQRLLKMGAIRCMVYDDGLEAAESQETRDAADTDKTNSDQQQSPPSKETESGETDAQLSTAKTEESKTEQQGGQPGQGNQRGQNRAKGGGK